MNPAARPRGQFDPRPLLRTGAAVGAPAHTTRLGALWAADCMAILPALKDASVDTVFADPPFNLGKAYGARTNDRIADADYVAWCQGWLRECARVLKPGGALFVYNLPKWSIVLGAFLVELGLDFRHWIAIEMSASFPIAGRLHPSHYGLLYFTRGKPKTFRRIRTPIATCRHCGLEVKDYGGHRKAMNPRGVTLKDVWSDVPPVRHWKFKSRARRANALSTKVLDRVVEMSTVPGDVVLDPFGGSGTTFAVCESKGRRWLGMEIDFAREIAERLETGDVCAHANDDHVDGQRAARKRSTRAAAGT
jgi:site-specific DNA-methyltransferase (adenine-specific)